MYSRLSFFIDSHLNNMIQLLCPEAMVVVSLAWASVWVLM